VHTSVEAALAQDKPDARPVTAASGIRERRRREFARKTDQTIV